MDLTKALSIYAAILSTAIFLWNIKRSRPKIDVLLMLAVEEADQVYEHGVSIIIQNPSSHTIHIIGASILYRYQRPTLKDRLRTMIKWRKWPRHEGMVYSHVSNYNVADGCPKVLEPLTSHSIFLSDAILDEIFEDAVSRELVAVVQDALGQNFHSVRFEYPKSKTIEESEVST